jgi:hypothetical protein
MYFAAWIVGLNCDVETEGVMAVAGLGKGKNESSSEKDDELYVAL